MTLTQDVLRQRLDYDADTGILRWLARPREHFATQRAHSTWNARYVGTKAGSIKKTGYRRLSIDDQEYWAHRIIWLWMTGTEPVVIDHKNGVLDDNRWQNLRNTNMLGNAKNCKIRVDNTTGVTGVFVDKSRGKFSARISDNRRVRYIGRFATLEAAIDARRQAELELGYLKR